MHIIKQSKIDKLFHILLWNQFKSNKNWLRYQTSIDLLANYVLKVILLFVSCLPSGKFWFATLKLNKL